MGSNGDDCNALVMLPGTRSQARKKTSHVQNRLLCYQENDFRNSKNKIKLTKYHKRRLKKLEESKHFKIKGEANSNKSQRRKQKKLKLDKEKAELMKRSIEDLEKYTIPENVGLLLQASCKLGQSETMLEKRRKVVQYFKSGLDLPKEYNNDHKMRSFDGPVEEGDDEMMEVDDDTRITESLKIVDVDDTCSRAYSTEVAVDRGLPFECDDDNLRVNSHEVRVDVERTVAISSSEGRGNPGEERCLIAPVVVRVSRPSGVTEERKDLPIVMMEQEIMEAVNENPTVIICGETGCGKTTQLPQFVYEAGYGSDLVPSRSGMVGVTQPRRVAVLATARRLAHELGFRFGNEVGFQVRYDKKMGDCCSIKVMTDGILLREIQSDLLLRRYSVIIVDEAHERSLNTDILIGMLSRVPPLRQQIYNQQKQRMEKGQRIDACDMVFPLKIILMSATLRVQDFVSGQRVFRPPPPVVEIPTRQFPVTIHFSRKTELSDYITAAYKKVLFIHKNLRPGGILVFLTGQKEVQSLCRRLHRALLKLTAAHPVAGPASDINEGVDIKKISEAYSETNTQLEEEDEEDGTELEDDGTELEEDETEFEEEEEEEEDVCSYNDNDGCDEGNVLERDGALASLKAAFEALAGERVTPHHPIHDAGNGSSVDCVPGSGKMKRTTKAGFFSGFRVLPLYAMLSAAAQLRVFDSGEEGERLIVVATNVAETSLTIPGIKYVVDAGREKVKSYSSSSGMVAYQVQWISKASAAQRAGRSGRTGPGHCYRLYSSAVFNNMFSDFSVPEISKTPVDGVVLLMKSMGIHEVKNFPFPTPPEAMAVKEAEQRLQMLGALDECRRLTSLGTAMAQFPMSPRHSRMLLTVIQIIRKKKKKTTTMTTPFRRQHLLLGYAVAVASALSLPSPFTTMQRDDVQRAPVEDSFTEVQEEGAQKMARGEFCNQTSDALMVACALRSFELSTERENFCADHGLHLKTMDEMTKLRVQLLRLVISQSTGSEEFSWGEGIEEDDVEVAWRGDGGGGLSRREEEMIAEAIFAGWADRVARRTREGDSRGRGTRYQARGVEEKVYLRSTSSSLSTVAPEFVVYTELVRTTKRAYMDGVTCVNPSWVAKYAATLCTMSAPVAEPKPYYDPYEDTGFWWVAPAMRCQLLWELPLHKEVIGEEGKRVAVFACALLEGKVLPCVGEVKEMMVGDARSLLREESGCGRRGWELLRRMKEGRRMIDSCRALRAAWEEDDRRLYREMLEWFGKGFENRFEILWSKMLQEALLEPEERYPKPTRRKKKKKKKRTCEN